MSDDVFKDLLEVVKRREWSGKSVKECKGCGSDQIQLTDWFTENLQYKCRKCKLKFTMRFEGE